MKRRRRIPVHKFQKKVKLFLSYLICSILIAVEKVLRIKEVRIIIPLKKVSDDELKVIKKESSRKEVDDELKVIKKRSSKKEIEEELDVIKEKSS